MPPAIPLAGSPAGTSSFRPGLTSQGASVWQAPLVPVALAGTAGIVLDRYLGIPLGFSLLAVVVSLIAWILANLSKSKSYSLLYLWLATIALGSG